MQIPADDTSIGAVEDIFNVVQQQIRSLIENAPPTSQIGGMYRSFINEVAIEKIDDKPLRADLKAIAAIGDRQAFTRFMGQTNGRFGLAIVTPAIGGNPANPTRVLWLRQGGLGLPDRDYYSMSSFKPQLDAYRQYIERTFRMIAYPEPSQMADAVVAFETALAKVSWPAADRRDLDKINNPMSLDELQAYAPGVNWAEFFTAAGIIGNDRVIVAEKSAVRDIAAQYTQTPLPTLKAWQAFHVTDGAWPYLSKRFVGSRFRFTTALNGMAALPPRWKLGVNLVNWSVGDLLGHAYVDTYFPAASKTTMIELVDNLKLAMAARIQKNDWMRSDTKRAALDKLRRMEIMVGFPDEWRDYSKLRVDPGDLYGNVERSLQNEWVYQLSSLNKPVNRKAWAVPPQTVNAFYAGLQNRIILAAGHLQAPFFDPHADSAVNYGAVGVLIGHEISHGFDDQGRKIDAAGTVRDWWTKADADRFDVEAKRFGAQYDMYEPLPGMHVNGQLTIGENLADLAGVLVALDAYHMSLHGRPAPVLDGLSGDERFFQAYAQSRRAKLRESAMRYVLTTDAHSPPAFRIIGPLRNVDAWYTTFHVTTGRYFLNPEERARIW